MKRRRFLQHLSAISAYGALGMAVPLPLSAHRKNRPAPASRVVLSRNEIIPSVNAPVNSDRLMDALDAGLQALFDRDHPLEAWRKVVRPGEVIGIKVNCLSGRGSTHPELVAAVIERLQQAGVKARDIIVWDRLNRDLEEAGFKINTTGNRPRVFGNDEVGFDDRLETYGQAASLVTRTVSRLVDGIINLPNLKDHSIAGVTISLKSMFGAIHNPNKYHLNVGDPYIADVNMLPSLRGKIRLNICDAVEAQYEGGPSYMPQWRWPLNHLLISRDRVALDYVGWQIIEKKRKEEGLPSLRENGREPTYIATAAGHGLGTNDPGRIKIIKV